MFHRSKTVIALLGTLLVLSVPGAQAASVSFNSDPALFGPLAFNWAAGAAEFSFPQWDPTLYGPGSYLVAIEIELEGIIGGTHSWDYTTGTEEIDIQQTTTGTITLFSPGGGTVVVTTPSQMDAYVDRGPAPDSDSATLSGSDIQTGFVDPGDFALFTGSGTVTTPMTGSSLSGGGHTGGGGLTISFSSNPTGSAGGQITYYYADEIPEPGTVALMALGLVGLAGFVSRRRKRPGQHEDIQ